MQNNFYKQGIKMSQLWGNNITGKAFQAKQILFRRYAVKNYQDISLLENTASEILNEIGFARRKAILQYAYEYTAYYKKRFDDIGLHPQDIKNENDWSKVPVLTKDDIRNNYEKIQVTCVPKKYFRTITTGGSTGEPMKLFHDRRYPLETLGWRTWRWWGVYPGENMALSWRLLHTTSISKLVNKIMWYPTKRIWLDASLTTEKDMERFIVQFNNVKPAILHGYVGAVVHLAQYCLNKHIRVFSPTAVSTTSAPLSVSQRTIIESAFQAPVYDQYACSEIYWVAAQCKERKHLHINTDVRHVEFLDDQNHLAFSGAVTITDLVNRVFPLIRYQNGDIGTSVCEKCSCGLPFDIMETVKGRVTDNIILQNGKIIAGDFVTTIFDDFPDSIKGFQVYQNKDYSVTLSVIPNQDYLQSDQQIDLVSEMFSKKLYGLPFHVKKVNEIPHDRGKTRFIISDVHHET
jgi:phenylacetate-CoA ligase